MPQWEQSLHTHADRSTKRFTYKLFVVFLNAWLFVPTHTIMITMLTVCVIIKCARNSRYSVSMKLLRSHTKVAALARIFADLSNGHDDCSHTTLWVQACMLSWWSFPNHSHVQIQHWSEDLIMWKFSTSIFCFLMLDRKKCLGLVLVPKKLGSLGRCVSRLSAQSIAFGFLRTLNLHMHLLRILHRMSDCEATWIQRVMNHNSKSRGIRLIV